jgi:7,8-dihydroneopterin aldolase/epimerase/oxygenase
MGFTFIVKLEAMKFHAHIGVLPHEAEFAQPLEVDVSAWVFRDELAHGGQGVLDYRRIYEIVSGIISAGHILYLEDLAAAIGDQVLSIEGVARVLVNARKPQVTLDGPLSFAQVTLDRARDE